MKHLITIALLATAATACSKAEDATPADDATATATATEAAATDAATAVVMAADGKPAVGTYTVTHSDGTVTTEELKADGTYVSTDKDGKVVETGTYVQKSAEEYCYTVDAAYVDADTPAGEQCNAEGIDEKGVWFSRSKDGKTGTVVRVTG